MANYLTMVFDYSSKQIYEYFRSATDFPFPNYANDVQALTAELDQILSDKNVTVLELLESIAINCTSFVTFCEIHSVFIDHAKCCDTIFNSRPIFSREGTCFTTKKRIMETTPYAFSSVKVWLNTELVLTPGSPFL